MEMKNQEEYSKVAQRAFDEFVQALKNADFFECAKRIGVLEYLEVPDIDYYSASSLLRASSSVQIR